MATKRKANEITKQEDIDYFLSKTPEELESTSFITETFGDFNGKSKFNTYDIITIPPGTYSLGDHKNKKSFRTTLGLWVFNKVMIERDFGGILGYINKPITKKNYAKIQTQLSYAFMEDKITSDQINKWLDRTQKFQAYSTILASNQSIDLLLCSAKVEKKKIELQKKYAKELKAGDLVTVTRMEKELIDYAKEILKDDPALDYFDSGAAGSYGNNFKNMYVMKGAIKDPDPTKGYNIVLSNYSQGVSKEDYNAMANSLAAGPYSRGKKTQNGGYWEKLLLSAFQHIILDEPGSDCGTKRTKKVYLTDDNISRWMYSYIQDGSNRVELTSENRGRYIGKEVKIYTIDLCEGKNICNKCAGNLFYRLGIRNIGAATPQIASKLKNIAMKAFHDSVARLTEIDPMKAFGEK